MDTGMRHQPLEGTVVEILETEQGLVHTVRIEPFHLRIDAGADAHLGDRVLIDVRMQIGDTVPEIVPSAECNDESEFSSL